MLNRITCVVQLVHNLYSSLDHLAEYSFFGDALLSLFMHEFNPRPYL
jgi:hypothetical protein